MHGEDKALPPPKKVKLVDAPEGMEFNKSARLPYPPGTGQGVKKGGKGGRPRKKISAIIEVSMPQGKKENSSSEGAMSTLLQVGSGTVEVINQAGYAVVPSVPDARPSKHSGTEVPLTTELLQQITGSDPDMMRAYINPTNQEPPKFAPLVAPESVIGGGVGMGSVKMEVHGASMDIIGTVLAQQPGGVTLQQDPGMSMYSHFINQQPN